MQRLFKRLRIDGVAAGAPIEITYTVVLRAEFVPAGAGSGPTKDLCFKVSSKGTCQVPVVIIGFPVLDAEPYGLGWVVHPTVHTFSDLKVSPRLEVERRNQYVEAKAADQALHGIPHGQGAVRDSAPLLERCDAVDQKAGRYR